MKKTIPHTYSRYSKDAIQLLSNLIRVARKERKITTLELSERAGISRGLLQRIEKGDLNCKIGAVFEVAAIVGVKLFDTDDTTLSKYIRETDDKLTLLPKSIRMKTRTVDDDF